MYKNLTKLLICLYLISISSGYIYKKRLKKPINLNKEFDYKALPDETPHEKPADDEIKEFIKKFTPEINGKISEMTKTEQKNEFEAISYILQIVSGVDYIVKVRVISADSALEKVYYHVKIFVPIQQSKEATTVREISGPKKETDELTFF